MKQEQASSTAKLIAAATILLDAEARQRALVAPGAAALSRRFLSGSRRDRWLAWSAGNPVSRRIWRAVERLTHPGILAHFWHRKRWIEERCRDAIAEGYGRVVVIGAGFDTLGYRLSHEFRHLNVIEIDHPATQAAKRRAIGSEGPVLVPVDLTSDELPPRLVAERAHTIVVLEGLLMYLPPGDVDRLLASLRGFTAPRLRIILSFMTRWPDDTSGFRPRSWLIERWLALRGESFAWSIEPEAVRDFLAVRGFETLEVALTRELSGGESALDGENLLLCERLAE